MNRNMKELLDHQLSTLTWSEADSHAMMDKLKGEQPVMKRKISAALVFAVIMMIALSGIAVAASLGAFSHFAGENNQNRLQLLDENAQDIGATVSVDAPALTNAPKESNTLYDEILAYQDDYTFTLTLDKAYSDGKKLYYAYTLKSNRAPQTTFGDGKPSGFNTWAINYSSDKYSNKLMDYISCYDEAQNAAFRAWFNHREEAYAISDYIGVGDGCRLRDGRDCNIYDSGEAWIDEYTLSGFQEVELPENAVEDGKINFVLSVSFGTAVYYQNANGAYRTDISLPWPDNIIKIPMTATVNGAANQLAGSFSSNAFTAQAELSVSDVEMFGAVTLKHQNANDIYTILDYDLVTADGTALHNLEGALEHIDNQTLRIKLRYDLPANLNNLVLRPHDAVDASMDIALK